MRDFEELGGSWCRQGGQTLPGSLLPGLVGPRLRGGTGTGNGGNQAVSRIHLEPQALVSHPSAIKRRGPVGAAEASFTICIGWEL